jgi:argininosuccinate lyase
MTMAKPPAKAWSGRFAESGDPDLDRFSRSVATDIRMWRQDVAVNRAWADALAAIGIYTRAEIKRIGAALDQITAEFHRDDFQFEAGDEDIHMAIERRLTEIAGESGARIHTGRSRNDQIMTDIRLWLLQALPELDRRLHALQQTLIDRAGQHLDTVMPGYTHLQQAQPISLAHYLLSLFWPIGRDRQRLAQALGRVDEMPLGSGALAGSGFPIDRRQLAEALGFRHISQNSIDAVSDRDVLVDAAHVCVLIMAHLSRYAEDLILWSSREFGFVTLSDAMSTGSSIMPQKKNPDSLELVRGKTARVMGQAQVLQVLLKGLPMTYARDLQEDKPALFDIMDQTTDSVAIFTRALGEAGFFPDRMLAALDDLLLATDLADYLTRRGMPFRRAHHTVGKIVREAIERGEPLASFGIERLRAYSKLFAEDAFEAVSTSASLNARNLAGGTGPKSVRQQIRRARTALKKPS